MSALQIIFLIVLGCWIYLKKLCSEFYTHLNNLIYMQKIYGYLMFKHTQEKSLGLEMS